MKTLRLVLPAALLIVATLVFTQSSVLAQETIALSYDQAVSGSLAAGQSINYLFTGAAGDKVSVDMSTTGGELDPVVTLYDPQGKLIGESTSNQKYNARLQGVVLSAAGSYRLVVSNSSAQGSGTFGLVVLREMANGAIFYDTRPTDRQFYELSQPLDTRDVTYRLINTQPGFDPAVVRGVITQAFQAWTDVTDLTFREVPSGQANLNIQFGQIDGNRNILGEACPPSSPCAGDIQFDADEQWSMGSTPETRAISLLGVATHEFGHAIGLLHSNNPDALMYYAYSPYNLTPSADDVAGIQRLYGRSAGRAANSPTSIPDPAQDPALPTVRGTLDDSQFTQFWDFDVEAGDTVTITMRRTSGNLDAVLVLLDANNNVLAYDDDSSTVGGNGTNNSRDAALLNVRLPQRGSYTVAATRYEQAQGFTTGNYTLTITYNDQPVPTEVSVVPTPAGRVGNGSVRVSKGQVGALDTLASLDSVLDQPFTPGITPEAQTRNAVVQRNQSYVWALTWCAIETGTVQANIRSLNVVFAVNGTPVDPLLVARTEPRNVNGQSCVDYLVTLSGWSGSSVVLTRTLTLRSNVFDGNLVFATGDYVDQVTVTIR